MVVPMVLCSMALGHLAPVEFKMQGKYVEGCACQAPCTCEMTGLVMGCEGVGAFEFTGGDVGGASLAGCRAAYATVPGKWVILYIDAPDAVQKAAAEKMMRYGLDGFGKVEAVRNAKISMTGSGGNCRVTVGSYFTLTTKPMIGGDGKSALVYGNMHDRIHPTVMGGTTIACKYHDGKRKFDLKGSNAFFNEHLSVNGKL